MSRIDEALKALERGGAARGGATLAGAAPPAASTTPLELYEGEAAAAGSGIRTPASRTGHAKHAPPLPRRGLTPLPAASEADGKLISRHTPPVLVEQYRRLAASLHDAQMERKVNTVMVTSAIPREGKTLTTVNLALTLSDSYGRRVLVVDADLRRPSIHQVFGVDNTRGLTDALSDHSADIPIVEQSSNLSVLPAGHAGPTPLAGLTSQRMGDLLDAFAGRFDWVLIDTPPVGFLPDAQLLARLIEAVVFVIGAGSTPSSIVQRAIEAVGEECILGVVLNRVDESQIQDAGYYYGGADVPSSRVR